MTSVLNVDSIAAKDGTSPVELTKQSAAKAWSKLNGTGTISLYDSFNISSVADNGTGDYTHTMTSAMSNANYSHTFTARTYFAVFRDGQTATTTTYRIGHIYNDGGGGNFGYSDGSYISANIIGDLA